jgi:hypothetical protein
MNDWSARSPTARARSNTPSASGDRQAVCDSRLLLGETHLRRGELRLCEEQLNPVLAETADTSADLAVSGEAQRLHGLLSLARGRPMLAAQYFGRSVSIYEMLGDRYRSARSLYDLGRAYASAQPNARTNASRAPPRLSANSARASTSTRPKRRSASSR